VPAFCQTQMVDATGAEAFDARSPHTGSAVCMAGVFLLKVGAHAPLLKTDGAREHLISGL